MFEVELEEGTVPALGPPLVVKLVGGRVEIGRAYADLLGNQTIDTYNLFVERLIPDAAVRVLFAAFADFLWEKYAKAHVPAEFLEELRGMSAASPPGPGRSVTVADVTRRFNVLANLPADVQNLITMLQQELEKELSPAERELINAIIDALDGCTWCSRPQGGGGRLRLPWAPGCDSYGVWGSRTEGGRLYTMRNLDWNKNTGAARVKLVTIVDTPGTRGPYAMFGFGIGLGALAGMSSVGLTVAEMNLDNSLTTFDGPPFPMRLRLLLERSRTLAEARSLWQATNNTDSMNYMVGSAADREALAVEAIGGAFGASPPHAAFSAFFGANDPVEQNATCAVGRKKGGACGTGFADVPAVGGLKRIGRPLPDAVWRTNHAVHPAILRTQEPLFNDTTFRYGLLSRLIEQAGAAPIGGLEAVQIAAVMGIKGPDFFSCDPAQFARGDHVMSVVYAPTDGAAGADAVDGVQPQAWVAWEDVTAAGVWTPAACSTYVRFDMAELFAQAELG